MSLAHIARAAASNAMRWNRGHAADGAGSCAGSADHRFGMPEARDVGMALPKRNQCKSSDMLWRDDRLHRRTQEAGADVDTEDRLRMAVQGVVRTDQARSEIRERRSGIPRDRRVRVVEALARWRQARSVAAEPGRSDRSRTVGEQKRSVKARERGSCVSY